MSNGKKTQPKLQNNRSISINFLLLICQWNILMELKIKTNLRERKTFFIFPKFSPYEFKLQNNSINESARTFRPLQNLYERGTIIMRRVQWATPLLRLRIFFFFILFLVNKWQGEENFQKRFRCTIRIWIIIILQSTGKLRAEFNEILKDNF